MAFKTTQVNLLHQWEPDKQCDHCHKKLSSFIIKDIMICADCATSIIINDNNIKLRVSQEEQKKDISPLKNLLSNLL